MWSIVGVGMLVANAKCAGGKWLDWTGRPLVTLGGVLLPGRATKTLSEIARLHPTRTRDSAVTI